MGVFSRTMLMLTMAWLVGLLVVFAFLINEDSGWRDKFVAEANIRRAIAYRHVDIAGGVVAERGHAKGVDTDDATLVPENMGTAPYGLPGESASAPGGTDPLPGAKVAVSASQIQLERDEGAGMGGNFETAKQAVKDRIDELREQIVEYQRQRRLQDARLADAGQAARGFALTMTGFRYTIASLQQRVFNLDYEIQRAMIERDALTAELAQVENDLSRIDGQQVALEDSYYNLGKEYDRTIRVLAWYEQADPNLRKMADSTGRGWLRGKVIGVGDDPRTGVVSISLGGNEGVFEGQAFSIYRNGSYVGKMVVENVRPNVSIGRLEERFRGKRMVLENDSVKTAEPAYKR